MITFKKGLSAAMVGNIAAGIQLLILVSILSKLGTVEELGLFGYVAALLGPVYFICGLNLKTLVATDLSNERQKDYLIIRVCQCVLYSIVALIFYALNSKLVGTLILAFSFLKIIDLFADLINASNIRRHRVDIVSVSQVTRAIFVVAAFGLIYQQTTSLHISLFCAGIVSALVLILWDWRQSVFVLSDLNFTLLRLKGVWRNLKLRDIGLVAFIPVAETILVNLPRYVLSGYELLVDVGVFTVLTYLASPGILISTSIASLTIPRMRECWSASNVKRYSFYAYAGVVGGFGIGLIGIVLMYYFSDFFISLIFSEEYTLYRTETLMMFLGALFWFPAAMAGVALNAAQKYHHTLLCVIAALIAAILMVLFAESLFDSKLLWLTASFSVGMFVRFILSMYLLYKTVNSKPHINTSFSNNENRNIN